MRRRGLKIGLLSNSSRNLESSSPTTGSSADAVLTSGAHGKTKPHESIFLRPARAARRRSRRRRRWWATRSHEDVEGALAVGMQAVLLDREGRHPEVEGRLDDLRGLAAALGLA